MWRALDSTPDLEHALTRSGELSMRAARKRAERGEHVEPAATRVERSNEHIRERERGYEQGR